MSFRDAVYLYFAIGVALFVLVMVVAKRFGLVKTNYSVSTILMAGIVLSEIYARFTYGGIMGESATYRVAASIELVALIALLPIMGGGIVKIIIMMIYAGIIATHWIAWSLFKGTMFPYLDIVTILSYIQLTIILSSSLIERAKWYGDVSRILIRSPVMGGYFSYYISNHFNGAPTIYQREEEG